jgi:outer membrane protein assembly factor BamD (BamD/ComL family)
MTTFLKGECHLKMGETEPADLAFRTLLVKYPDSQYRSRAEAKLKKLKAENRG